MRVLLLLCFMVVDAKFCQRDEVATKVRIDGLGQPELDCERPRNCELPSGSQMHSCTYYQSGCPKSNEFVSGIHNSNKAFGVACCQSPYVGYSRFLGSTTLLPGDAFDGGDWKSKSGTSRGFDVISNIEKVVTHQGVMYNVTIVRITCPQRPQFDNTNHLTGALSHHKNNNPRNFAGNLQGDNDNDIQQQTQTDQQAVYNGFAQTDYGTVGDITSFDSLPPSFGPPPPGGLGVPETGFCFPEDARVTTPTGTKLMKYLRIDDKVLSINEGRIEFSKVESWLHRYPETNAEFVKLGLKDGTYLTLTPDHLIYHSPCHDSSHRPWLLTTAKEIQPGRDCAVKVAGDSYHLVEVISSEMVIGRGVYGPMTGNTNIIVNDMAASCYATVKDTIMLTSILHYARQVDSLCDSAARALGFKSEPQDLLNEMPRSLSALMKVADTVFQSNWKIMG